MYRLLLLALTKLYFFRSARCTILTQLTTVSVTRFKDLAVQIGVGDPDTKMLPPGVGLVKTNLCEWFENKYTLYF